MSRGEGVMSRGEGEGREGGGRKEGEGVVMSSWRQGGEKGVPLSFNSASFVT